MKRNVLDRKGLEPGSAADSRQEGRIDVQCFDRAWSIIETLIHGASRTRASCSREGAASELTGALGGVMPALPARQFSSMHHGGA